MDYKNKNDCVTFVVDSGATNHLVTGEIGGFLINTKSVNYKINVAKDGEVVIAKKQGTLEVKTLCGRKIKIENVLECANL